MAAIVLCGLLQEQGTAFKIVSMKKDTFFFGVGEQPHIYCPDFLKALFLVKAPVVHCGFTSVCFFLAMELSLSVGVYVQTFACFHGYARIVKLESLA